MNYLSDDSLNNLRRVFDIPDLGDDRYRIVRRIAVGGMASVYLADDALLQRPVAVKIMFPNDPVQFAERMKRESRLIAKLEHPSIIPIHDVRTLDDGRVFYVMKYVEGDTFDRFVNRRLGLAENLRTFQKVCEGVAFAHSRGVVHRDLKPSNVMVGSFGEVLIMDWGIAKLFEVKDDPQRSIQGNETVSLAEGKKKTDNHSNAQSEIVTDHGTVLGTPVYMSPEQARGDTEQIDERTDIYALGGLLYFLMTKRPPFECDSSPGLFTEITQIGPEEPRSIDRRISRRLQAVCLKAMANSKLDRYDSVMALSDDISLFLAGEPVSAYRENIAERAWRWTHKYRLILLIVIAYLVTRFILRIWFGP